MKQFLFVTLLALLSFSASAHRSGYGKSHGHHSQYAPSHNRHEYRGHKGGRSSYDHARMYHGNRNGKRYFSKPGNRGYDYNQMPSRGMRPGIGEQGNRGYTQPYNGEGGQTNQQYQGQDPR